MADQFLNQKLLARRWGLSPRTDDLYSERVQADGDCAEALLAKARAIIDASRPPARISEDPSWWQCRLCRHRALCHEGAVAERNCRTCLHSTTIDAGWHCERHDHLLPVAQQKHGCPQHLYIPDLVPGEVVDAGDQHVVYRMMDGAQWVDGLEGLSPVALTKGDAPC